MKRRIIIALLLLSASIGFGLLTERSASARRAVPNPVVTNLNDSDAGSLRQAISDADPGSTITFQAGLTGTITLASELTLDKDLTINGPGANQLTVSGNNGSRVFFIASGATVWLDRLKVSGGNGNGASFSGFGGGIFNTGMLTLTNSTVSNNSVRNHGGGIENYFGTLTIAGSAVSNNSAGVDGGGIFNAGTLTLTGSAVSNNFAGYTGGGFHNNLGTLALINSTISNNSTSGRGGGVDNFLGTLTLTNCTLTSNRANSNGDSGEIGGGIHAQGTERLRNTIVAGNFVGTGTTPDDINYGTIDAADHNLIGDAATAAGITDGANGNIVGNNGAGTRAINTILNTTLANNGGPTLTHALVAGSPAINAGSNALAVDEDSNPLTTDQRGAGFPRIVGSTVDIGAFELGPTFNFSDFFAPVDNPPLVNVARAGAAIPVKFSLGGDQGLGIFAPGYPTSQQIACSSAAPADEVEETVTAGASSLSYDPTTELYTYVWKTSTTWRNTCRRLTIKLSDGTLHTANFQFR